MIFDVINRASQLRNDGTFADVVAENVERIPRQHNGWQSITYMGQRFQLSGGIRTRWFVNLDCPIKAGQSH